MNFEEWEPIYEEILEYFCFDRADDEKAAKILSELCQSDNISELTELLSGNVVTVCGNAPSLPQELGKIKGVVCAADAATDTLVRNKIKPDVIFTDLDGADENVVELNKNDTIVVIHAHGDNIPLIKTWTKKLSGMVVCTTQAGPFSNLHNFGGFTDGDRAVYTAHSLLASEIILAGFDLDDKNVDPIKHGKLMWARRLLKKIGYDV